MPSAVPQRVDPCKLLDTGGRVEGRIPLGELTRLGELLHEARGSVWVGLEVRREKAGRPVLHLELDTELQLTCQRCLQAVTWPVRKTIQLECADDAAAAERLENAVLIENGGLSPAWVAEDELILALPIVARHSDDSGCMPYNPAQPGQDQGKSSPFDVLGHLKS